MIIGLSTYTTDTITCEQETKTKRALPQTIKRRHSFNSMMKFLSNRDALFMIPELPLVEEHYSSSFTAGASPTKPRTRKTAKMNKATNFTTTTETKTKKKKKSIVRTSLAKALSIVDKATFSVKQQKMSSPVQSSLNSVTTCSTASLTDEESEISSNDNDKDYEKREAKEEKREAAALWEAPLLRGNRRWDEQSLKLGDEHFLYTKVRQKRSDSAPICPVRR